ncbi:hypothetical protein ACRAWD_18345 [Caulobacter segnis]
MATYSQEFRLASPSLAESGTALRVAGWRLFSPSRRSPAWTTNMSRARRGGGPAAGDHDPEGDRLRHAGRPDRPLQLGAPQQPDGRLRRGGSFK